MSAVVFKHCPDYYSPIFEVKEYRDNFFTILHTREEPGILAWSTSSFRWINWTERLSNGGHWLIYNKNDQVDPVMLNGNILKFLHLGLIDKSLRKTLFECLNILKPKKLIASGLPSETQNTFTMLCDKTTKVDYKITELQKRLRDYYKTHDPNYRKTSTNNFKTTRLLDTEPFGTTHLRKARATRQKGSQHYHIQKSYHNLILALRTASLNNLDYNKECLVLMKELLQDTTFAKKDYDTFTQFLENYSIKLTEACDYNLAIEILKVAQDNFGDSPSIQEVLATIYIRSKDWGKFENSLDYLEMRSEKEFKELKKSVDVSNFSKILKNLHNTFNVLEGISIIARATESPFSKLFPAIKSLLQLCKSEAETLSSEQAEQAYQLAISIYLEEIKLAPSVSKIISLIEELSKMVPHTIDRFNPIFQFCLNKGLHLLNSQINESEKNLFSQNARMNPAPLLFQAFRLNKHHFDDHIQYLITFLENQKRWEKAIAFYKEALKIHPEKGLTISPATLEKAGAGKQNGM